MRGNVLEDITEKTANRIPALLNVSHVAKKAKLAQGACDISPIDNNVVKPTGNLYCLAKYYLDGSPHSKQIMRQRGTLNILRDYCSSADQCLFTCGAETSTLELPFVTVASNQSSRIAVGDEAGGFRVIYTDRWPVIDSVELNSDYYQCHENSIFDLSWSLDDSKIVSFFP